MSLLGAAILPGSGIDRTIEWAPCRKTQRGLEGDISIALLGTNVVDPRAPSWVPSAIFSGLVIVYDPVTDAWINPVADTSYAVQASVVGTVDVSVGAQTYTLRDKLGATIVSVVTAPGDTTNNAVRDRLNADATFALFFVADTTTGKLRITARAQLGVGARGIFGVSGTGATAVAMPTTLNQGQAARYLVMVDEPTALRIGSVDTPKAPRLAALGDFFEDRLSGLTVEGREVLLDRGSLFYSA